MHTFAGPGDPATRYDVDALPRLAVQRGIPFSHTCSRLQYFARRDYLKIGLRDLRRSNGGIPEIDCRAEFYLGDPKVQL